MELSLKLRFYNGSNLTRSNLGGVPVHTVNFEHVIAGWDATGESHRQKSQLEIRLNAFTSVKHFTETIHHHYIFVFQTE